ncbi:MAG: bifunctional nuclease family protein [Planctomycetota bacterium]
MEVEISRIIISEIMDAQAILLKEKDGNRTIPIIIGIVEALALDRAIKAKKAIRPMTHDLLVSILEILQCKLQRVIINDLKGGTFFAELHLEQNGKSYTIDCRPSDALVLASHFKSPIYVLEDVFLKTENPSDEE